MPKINRYWNSDPDSLVEREPPQTYDLCKCCELVNQLVWKEKKLKRALWLARALALSRFDVEEYLRKYTHCDSRYWNDGLHTFNEACKLMQKAINRAEAICKAKAEEYK